MRRELTLGVLCLVPAVASAKNAPTAKPNILFITADDLGYEFLGCTGNKTPDLTPNLDRLAGESLMFTNAFVTASVSQPSRGSWITGCYPHRNGAIAFNPVTQPRAMLGEQMRKAGYHTGLFGKGTHFAPVGPEHWDDYAAEVKGLGRDADEFVKIVKGTIESAHNSGKPFFIIANCADPHRPFSKSSIDYEGVKDPSRLYTPEEVDVPGFLCDIPETRQELAYYCNSVRRLDDVAGAMLRLIDQMNLRDNTVVIFASDNGSPLPFGKGSCYLQSDKTPLMIRMKGLAPGLDQTHFLNGIDMMPTILEIVGAPLPAYMDGRSFLPLLKGGKQPERDHVVVVYHRDHFRSMEIRAIHNARYGYVYNEWRAWEEHAPSMIFISDNNIGVFGPATDPVIAARRQFYLRRAPEELYDYSVDPIGLKNLAEDPAYAITLNQMRDQLNKWMIDTGDHIQTGYTIYIARQRDKEKK